MLNTPLRVKSYFSLVAIATSIPARAAEVSYSNIQLTVN
jgi:hypothetical protein